MKLKDFLEILNAIPDKNIDVKIEYWPDDDECVEYNPVKDIEYHGTEVRIM